MAVRLTCTVLSLLLSMRAMNKITAHKAKAARGSASVWLDAAYTLLIEQGVESVKVMPLAKSLGLSRTSFYWHFEDREALLEALLQQWKSKNTDGLIAQTEAYAESITEAVFNVFDCWINPVLFDAKLDFAIRNWAQQSADLKQVVDENDRERIAAIIKLFERFNYVPIEADARARTLYYTQIGYISLTLKESFSERLSRMPAYIQCFTGRLPTDSEIQRFKSRHHNQLD